MTIRNRLIAYFKIAIAIEANRIEISREQAEYLLELLESEADTAPQREERKAEMYYDKLVRDDIPEIIEETGKKAICKTLDDEEYKVCLEKKLDEEVAEFHESKSVEELADILEVIRALSYVYAKSFAEVDNTRFLKAVKRGGFQKRICLIEVKE